MGARIGRWRINAACLEYSHQAFSVRAASAASRACFAAGGLSNHALSSAHLCKVGRVVSTMKAAFLSAHREVLPSGYIRGAYRKNGDVTMC